MRYFPDPELTVLTRCKKYIFQLVVVDQSHSVCKGSLKHQYALSTLFNVSDAHQPFLSALTVAWHSRKPLKSTQAILTISFITVDCFDHCRFYHASIYQLNDRDYTRFCAAQKNIAIGVKIHIFDIIAIIHVLPRATQSHRMYHHRTSWRFDIENKDHALACRDIKPLKVRVQRQIKWFCIRSFDDSCGFFHLEVLTVDDPVLTGRIKQASVLVNYHRFDATVDLHTWMCH